MGLYCGGCAAKRAATFSGGALGSSLSLQVGPVPFADSQALLFSSSVSEHGSGRCQ